MGYKTRKFTFLLTSFHTVNIWDGSTGMGSALHQTFTFFHTFYWLLRLREGVFAHTHASFVQLERGVCRGWCDTEFRSRVPQIHQTWARSLKFHCALVFTQKIYTAFEWDISRVKSWRRRACARVCVYGVGVGVGGWQSGAERETYRAPQSHCLPALRWGRQLSPRAVISIKSSVWKPHLHVWSRGK